MKDDVIRNDLHVQTSQARFPAAGSSSSTGLPVVRSVAARTLFLASAVVTAIIYFWAHALGLNGSVGLTPIFYFLFTRFDYQASMWTLLTLTFAIFIPGRVSFRPLLRWIGEHPLLIATAIGLSLCAGSLLVYRDHPLAMDEYAPYFQSQVFASGHLTGRFPVPLLNWLIPEGFQDYFLYVSKTSGAVASAYWPSFALLLAPFTWLGIPWACNPFISALTVLAIHRLAMQIFEKDPEPAGLAILLTIASPVFFADGISYYSMSAHLLANTVYAVLLLRQTPRTMFTAGAIGSIALTLHNPFPHILFALPWIVWAATKAGGVRLLGWLAAGYTPLCLLLGIGWFWFTIDLSHAGLVSTPGGAAGALEHIANAFSMPGSSELISHLIGVTKIWSWSIPGLLILAAAGAWQWRHNTACRLLLTSAVLTLAGYFAVHFDQGHGWGYRYFHSAWVALPILGAAALTRVSDRGSNESFDDSAVRTFFVGCALLTLVVGVSVRAVQMSVFITHDVEQVPAYAGTEPRVVIIDTSRSFYGADLVQNDPWLRGSVIRMISHGRERDADMMRVTFPALQLVYSDEFGEVWSAATPRLPNPTASRAPTIR